VTVTPAWGGDRSVLLANTTGELFAAALMLLLPVVGAVPLPVIPSRVDTSPEPTDADAAVDAVRAALAEAVCVVNVAAALTSTPIRAK
jgi:hypothetical protein